MEKLKTLKDTLPFIQSITLSYNEIEKMSLNERKALGAIFPNAKKITLLDKHGRKLEPHLESSLVRTLGFNKVSSLYYICSFFVATHKKEIEAIYKKETKLTQFQNALPIEVKENIASALMPN